MMDPKRLIDGDGADLGVQLLREWRAQQPSAGAQTRTAAALGLGTAALVTTKTTIAATAAGGAVTAAVSGATTATGLELLALKWLGLGIALGSVIVVGVSQVLPAPDHSSRDQAVEPQTSALSSSRREVAAIPVVATPHAAVPAPSARANPPPIPRSSPSRSPISTPDLEAAAERTPPTEAPAEASLSREVATLETARQALAAQDAAGAERALTQYESLPPSGALAPEATLIRIDALVLRGQTAVAARLANDYLTRYPRTPHAARLRRIVASSPTGTGPGGH